MGRGEMVREGLTVSQRDLRRRNIPGIREYVNACVQGDW